MFHQLYKVLTKENLLEQSFEKSEQAMIIISEMFEKSVAALRSGEKDDTFNIYVKDKEVNQIERDIRRQSLTHLALTGQDDLNPTLVLITIIHDVERLGDYTKNIFELSEKLETALTFSSNEAEVKKVEESIHSAFKSFKEGLNEINTERSRMLMESLSESQKSCEEIISSIVSSADEIKNKKNELIVGVLYVRFLKRVAAHLNNIATSSVNPFDRIGFEE